MDNLWKKWEETPKEIVKEDEAGLKTVSLLGLYGETWGLKDISHSKFNLGNLVLAEIRATFFYVWENKRVEFEINNSIPVTNRNEDGTISFNPTYMKALETDTIAKALSRLGLFADLYADEEMVSDTKHEIEMKLIEIGDEND